jgi:hypothetical protein
MRRRLYITVFALALLLLALLGWTADGIRWALAGRPRLSPAG